MITSRRERSGLIAVLGSANIDLVVSAARAPGPGETVAGRSFRRVPGGKGANQALAAARAGGVVAFAGAVGDDEFGRQIAGVLETNGVDIAALERTSEATGMAHITVDDTGENSIVVLSGANGTVTSLADSHRAVIEAADVLLLQLELPMSLVVEAAQYARSRDVFVVLTPAPVLPLSDRLLGCVDLLIPNEHEALLLTGGVQDALPAATYLARRCGAVVVTLGARGALHVNGMDTTRIPAFPVDLVDTTAAGDTFVGVLAVGLTEGLDIPAAARRASAAAALSVQRFGASSSMPTRAEIDVFLTERNTLRPPPKDHA